MAGACRTWSNRGTFRRDHTSGDSRRRHGGASAPCSSATPWRRGSPPTWRGAVGRASDHSQRGAGKRTQPSTHGLARGSGAFAAAGGLPATDERRLDDSGSRLTRPPTPASTAAAVSRIRCWSRQQQPGDGPRERVRHGQTAALLGGILPQGVLVEGFGGRRHHLQVPKRGTLRFPLRGGWGAAGVGWGDGRGAGGGARPPLHSRLRGILSGNHPS